MVTESATDIGKGLLAAEHDSNQDDWETFGEGTDFEIRLTIPRIIFKSIVTAPDAPWLRQIAGPRDCPGPQMCTSCFVKTGLGGGRGGVKPPRPPLSLRPRGCGAEAPHLRRSGCRPASALRSCALGLRKARKRFWTMC